ncbi:MAG: phage holin family protein [Patescibacteria group bacterium]|nr:phage holin family protein [Patescibacteria group bacterium]
MKRLLLYIVAGFLGLYLATLLVPGVEVKGDFTETIKILFFAGVVLGLINLFLKPLLEFLTFPLKLLTFGLFSLVLNMITVELTDILFPKLEILGFWPLFWTGLLIWFLNLFLLKLKKRKSGLKSAE